MDNKCSYKGCSRETYRDSNFPETDKCIFHASEKDPQAFRNALAKQIREWRRAKAEEWDFSGFVFVDVARKDKYSRPVFNLFRRAIFPVKVVFDEGMFSGDAVFEGAIFLESAWFQAVTFSGNAQFWRAHFSKFVMFQKTVFSRDSDFVAATFSEEAWFWEAIFGDDAQFQEANFSGDAGFYSATFLGYAWFKNTIFKGNLDLFHASFAILGDFEECRIRGRVRVLWPGEGAKRDKKEREVKRGTLRFKQLKFAEGDILDLTDNVLQDDSVLVFHTCDMSRVLLKGTNCARISLNYCIWPEVHGRKVIGDEYVLQKNRSDSPAKSAPEWNRIAVNYQQLVKNFREELDHPTANDFERGVFEMRRRAALQRKNLHGLADYVLISCYKWLSDYSGSLLRPLVWLLISIPLFAFAYFRTSINAQVDPFFWNSWKLSLQIASLNRIGFEFVRDNRIWSDILVALQVVCTATLVALFLFAVRRRFKH